MNVLFKALVKNIKSLSKIIAKCCKTIPYLYYMIVMYKYNLTTYKKKTSSSIKIILSKISLKL